MDLKGFELFTHGFSSGFRTLFVAGNAPVGSGGVDLVNIILTSLRVSLLATAIALLLGIPAGYYLGTRRSVGRLVALIIANAGMGLPPTVAGLFVAMLLSRYGVFGSLSLLYTKTAIVIVQTVIATPVVAALVASGVAAVPAQLRLQVRSLGASRLQEVLATLREARLTMFAAVAAGFGAIISEVGAVTMVGGNLAGDTRVMTTAIVQFTRMGDYGPALVLAVILLVIVLLVNVFITSEQTRDERYMKAASRARRGRRVRRVSR